MPETIWGGGGGTGVCRKQNSREKKETPTGAKNQNFRVFNS